MTAVFRSCLPRFYSNTNQSISNETLSNKTNSIISFDNKQLDDENSISYSSLINNQDIIKSKTIPSQLDSSSQNQLINNETFKQKQTKKSRLKNNNTNTKKRGPPYSRINEKSQPLLKRLVSTIFGDHAFNTPNKTRLKRSTQLSKKSILPSKSTIKKQFEDNEQTLRSLVTLLTQIESNVNLTTNKKLSSNENQNTNLEEQARNNNRMDDTSSSHSNDSYHYKSKVKPNHQHSSASKRSRLIKKYHNNKKKQSEDDTLCSCSITSHYSLQSPSHTIRRKMVDNQQQTQIYPTKINTGTSTQFNHTHDTITSEPSWLDVMRDDQTTIDAWARIRRRLKPNQQKDILRALMIICANLFEVPIEKKHI